METVLDGRKIICFQDGLSPHFKSYFQIEIGGKNLSKKTSETAPVSFLAIWPFWNMRGKDIRERSLCWKGRRKAFRGITSENQPSQTFGFQIHQAMILEEVREIRAESRVHIRRKAFGSTKKTPATRTGRESEENVGGNGKLNRLPFDGVIASTHQKRSSAAEGQSLYTLI